MDQFVASSPWFYVVVAGAAWFLLKDLFTRFQLGQELQQKQANVIERMLAKLEEHDRRLDEMDRTHEAHIAAAAEIKNTVIENGAQARIAIADLDEVKTGFADLGKLLATLAAKLETSDARTAETARKVDRLYTLLSGHFSPQPEPEPFSPTDKKLLSALKQVFAQPA